MNFEHITEVFSTHVLTLLHITEQPFLTGTALVDNPPRVLEEDHANSITDGMEQPVFLVYSNPSYDSVSEHFQQQPAQQDDQVYSAIGDMEQPMCVVSRNPAYGCVPRQSQPQPVQQDDYDYVIIDGMQQQAAVTSGIPTRGNAPREGVSAKL